MDIDAVRSIFTTLPVDVVAITLFATVVTVDTLRAGASRAIALSLALITTTVLFNALPGTYLIGGAVSGIASAYALGGVFIVTALVLTFMLNRMTASLSDDSARPLFALLTASATTVIALAVWEMSPALQGIWHFNAHITLFFGELYRFFWLLLGLVVFSFVRS